MVMPEERVEDQGDVIIEQLNYGLLDFEEAQYLYGNDKAFFEHLLSSDEWLIEDLFACGDLKNPKVFEVIKNIALDAYKSFPDFDVPLDCLPNKLQLDKEVVLAAVSNNPEELEIAPSVFKDDKEVVMEAVLGDGSTLQFASPRLKDDKEVVMEAISNASDAFSCASKRLHDDKEVALAAISHNGRYIEYVSERLIDDKEFIMAVLSSNGDYLKYASLNLRDDREVVLAAVSNSNGDDAVFSHASKRLLNDKCNIPLDLKGIILKGY